MLQYTQALNIYSDQWCQFVAVLCFKISEGQKQSSDDGIAEELSDEQAATFDLVDSLMREFVEERESNTSN